MVAALWALTNVFVVAEESGMRPVPPQLMWKALPENLEEWNLLKSKGETGWGTWLESKVEREFERPIPPDPKAPADAPAPPPMWTRIQITDTGKHPESLAQFEDFSVEEPSTVEGMEKTHIHSWPAFVMTYDDGLIVAQILVANRFSIELVLKHQPRRLLKVWCRHMDFTVLKGIPDSEVIPLPEMVAVIKLDQLNPKKSRGYLMGTTSESRLESELEEESRYLEEVMGDIPELEEGEAEFLDEGEENE